MRRYVEALALGLASVAVLMAEYVALMSASGTEGLQSLAGYLVTSIGVAGLATLGYIAGRRQSRLGLVAIIAFSLVASQIPSIIAHI
jgi:hypothetical protein